MYAILIAIVSWKCRVVTTDKHYHFNFTKMMWNEHATTVYMNVMHEKLCIFIITILILLYPLAVYVAV